MECQEERQSRRQGNAKSYCVIKTEIRGENARSFCMIERKYKKLLHKSKRKA